VAKAKRAKSAGLDVMIDFHYSDFFTDPGRQMIPADWSSCTTQAQIIAKIEEHTKEILTAVKDVADIKWIQIGNELNSGMLFSSDSTISGARYKSSYTTPDGKTKVSYVASTDNYLAYLKAGIAAAKSVCSDAKIIIHMANAYKQSAQTGYFKEVASLDYDIIGLSHYPQDNSDYTYSSMNSMAVATIATLAKAYDKEIMICEVGTKYLDDDATSAMNDFISRLNANSTAKNAVTGIFYWEPQVYGWWKPTYYSTISWNAYDMGAYTSKGKPSAALSVMTSSGITTIGADISWVTEMEADSIKFYE
jgi:arabinogalactan endo-1,4-beta-galactosidase